MSTTLGYRSHSRLVNLVEFISERSQGNPSTRSDARYPTTGVWGRKKDQYQQSIQRNQVKQVRSPKSRPKNSSKANAL